MTERGVLLRFVITIFDLFLWPRIRLACCHESQTGHSQKWAIGWKLASPIELPTSYFSPCSINKGYWICDHASRIINTIFPSRIICGWFMLLSHNEIQERRTGRRINMWHGMILLHVILHREEIIQADRGLGSLPSWKSQVTQERGTATTETWSNL